jgi:hypothetical protein
MAEASKQRIAAGGPLALGRPSLSKSGYATLKRMIRARAGGLCEFCGSPGVDLDHVVFRSQGGADSWENCYLSCRHHNLRRHFGFHEGRLVVRAMGDGTFQGMVAWNKLRDGLTWVHPDAEVRDRGIFQYWQGGAKVFGRPPTPTERAKLDRLDKREALAVDKKAAAPGRRSLYGGDDG